MGSDDRGAERRKDAALTAGAVLESLAALADPLRTRLSQRIEVPELAPVLDFESRRSDQVRQFKHLHQHCVGHSFAYVTGTEMKVLHLADAFEQLAEAGNGLGIYPIARSGLELYAQVVDVHARLIGCRDKVTPDYWRPPGEEFFNTIVRARFATSNETHAAAMRAQGASKAVLKPMNAMNSIASVPDPAGREIGRRYAELCDAVHHNLSSTAAVSAGSGVADAARHPSGGAFVAHGPMTITAYEYPVVWKADIAIEQAGGNFVEDLRQTMDALENFPEHPFPRSLVEEITGSPLGIVQLPRRPDGSVIRPPIRVERPGRNDPCSCGSGHKYKHCCG